MIVCEFKASGRARQLTAIDEAIKTVHIRNKCILWMDDRGTGQATLQRHWATLANQCGIANELNSMAR